MDPSNLLSDFASAFTQDHRLLRLRFGADSGLANKELLPERLSGTEQLSACYRYQLSCLSPDAGIELKRYMGQPVEVGLLLSDNTERTISGLVTQTAHAGSDGGFARFELSIEPALALLAQRSNARVFQDLSVLEIVGSILDEHRASNPIFQQSFAWQNDLQQTYPQRSYCSQYRESDLAFITRLLAEEGISYRFSYTSSDNPLHTLILFDDPLGLPQNPQATLRFAHADEGEDVLRVWRASRQIGSAISALTSYDYKPVTTHQTQAASRIDQGEAGADVQTSLEAYDPQTQYYGADADELQRYAEVRQDARDAKAKTFAGQSNVRDLHVGHWFALDNHPAHEADSALDREFLVTSFTLDARNNLLQSDASSAAIAEDNAPYSNTFEALRRGIPLTPEHRAKPTAPGIQTATVVGPPGEEIHTDEHGRVKLQFHWQRPQDHPAGTASFDDKSSTWVRVIHSSAGANWGEQFIPRIGQEVLVDFIEGDIDRPIITGVLHNGRQQPPAFSDAGSLPANKTLSGIKSKEYKGSRYNELLFDDSTGEIRTKLSSEQGKTQLNLGYLIHPRTAGKGEPRGEGAELRTDQAAAIRAARGILLSTDARTHASGKQLDRQELVGLMQAVENLHQQLSELSSTHQAENTDSAKLTLLKQHVENWDKGSNTTGGKPIIAATSPAGIVLGSQDNIALAAQSHIDIVSQQSTQISTGGKFLLRAAEQISLFVHKLGMKLIAVNGKIEIQAQNDQIEMTAAKKLILTSLEEIIIQAPKITHTAQDAKIEMGAGTITTQCTGVHTQKAGSHPVTGPGGGSPNLPVMPTSEMKTDEKFAVAGRGGQACEQRPYELMAGEGQVLAKGQTGTDGGTEQTYDTRIKPLTLKLKDE
jgi:type VI secretion system secreted protein VgrG